MNTIDHSMDQRDVRVYVSRKRGTKLRVACCKVAAFDDLEGGGVSVLGCVGVVTNKDWRGSGTGPIPG